MKNVWNRLTRVRQILFVALAVVIVIDITNLVFTINGHSDVFAHVLEVIADFGTGALLVVLFVVYLRGGLTPPPSRDDVNPPAGGSE